MESPTTGRLHKNPTDRVYAFIMDKISRHAWPVSSKIMTESELCAALKVSRVAVREAVERVSTLGLLVKKQGSGTFVAKPEVGDCFDSLFPLILLDKRGICQLLEFRIGFESNNVKLFMRHHEPADIQALEENVARHRATPISDPEESGRLDSEFHQLLATGTKNPFVIRISKILCGILLNHQIELWRVADQGNAHHYHRDILKHLKTGDGKIAAALMRRHIKMALHAFQRHLEAEADKPAEAETDGPPSPAGAVPTPARRSRRGRKEKRTSRESKPEASPEPGGETAGY